MIRARNTPDGLPYRVYEYYGARIYSIGYKMRSNKWAFKFRCRVDDANQIRKLRLKAIEESTRVVEDMPVGGFKGLVDAWFEHQEKLPDNDARKRKDSTITENRNEADRLVKAWGHFEADEITRRHGYEYLEACLETRAEKGNKEIGLAGRILEWGIKKGVVTTNVLKDIEKNKRVKVVKRYVSHEELEIVVATGRVLGGPYHIIALALKTAWLCVRRPVEVRKIGRDAITDAGILWTDGKDETKPKILIKYSPELRATIEEVLSIKRNNLAGSFLLFGNLQGQQYTKPGWGKLLGTLMATAEAHAQALELPFEHFSLQDCRPKGVTDKLERGDTDTKDATLHSSDAMIVLHYDRRTNKKATPAG